jgi:hypothetical protein
MNPLQPSTNEIWKNSAAGAAAHVTKGIAAVSLGLTLVAACFALRFFAGLPYLLVYIAGIPVTGLFGYAFKHLVASGSYKSSEAQFDPESVTFRLPGKDPVRVPWTSLDRLITTEDEDICLIDTDDNDLFRFSDCDFHDPKALAFEIAERSGKCYNRFATAFPR